MALMTTLLAQATKAAKSRKRISGRGNRHCPILT